MDLPRSCFLHNDEWLHCSFINQKQNWARLFLAGASCTRLALFMLMHCSTNFDLQRLRDELQQHEDLITTETSATLNHVVLANVSCQVQISLLIHPLPPPRPAKHTTS